MVEFQGAIVHDTVQFYYNITMDHYQSLVTLPVEKPGKYAVYVLRKIEGSAGFGDPLYLDIVEVVTVEDTVGELPPLVIFGKCPCMLLPSPPPNNYKGNNTLDVTQ